MRVEEEALKLPAKHASSERMLGADVGVTSPLRLKPLNERKGLISPSIGKQ
jgi:hypothetical protein